MSSLRKLGRRTDHRNAMLRNLVQSVLENGRIQTSVTRAKEAQRLTDKMITLAKKGDLHSRRQALAFIYNPEVVEKLFDEYGPQYKDRDGGYTRVLRVGPRRGDATEMAILELV